MPVAKGTPLKELTPYRRKALQLCPPEERSTLLRRWRQRDSAKKYRARDREICLARTRLWRKKAVERGYYRVGGNGYRGTIKSEKRRKYFEWYNRNVRPLRMVQAQSAKGPQDA